MLDQRSPNANPRTPRASRLIVPNNLRRASAPERYEVAGLHALLIPLREGDNIRVVNHEGGQRAELIAADENGRIDAGVIGTKSNGTGEGTRALLMSGGTGLASLRKGLERRGIDLSTAGAVTLFGPDTRAGSEESFTVTRPGNLLIAAPGEPMCPHGQETSTSIIIFVQRAKARQVGQFDLPEPLADPLMDLRIHSATARSYFVKAGDYFQVLDVDGRQCTDLQCFDARKLDKGIVRPIDVTTSRTLMVHDYSRPGLHAKYFDHDMTPLIEVVQDTVGRHDAFALACSAKYYDDIGYPGHTNCSDNFNAELAQYEIEARKGWMAVNLFFNTSIDAHGLLISDEPWSRPGDYVMFRALTDIICISSACPDDTSPSNGWYLSDIHVRTYSGAEKFQRAAAWRPTPQSEPRMTKETAFHARTSALTGNFVEYRGYWLPQTYTANGAIDEYWACRKAAVIMDLSPLRKFEVTGPDAETLMNYAVTRDMTKLSVGQVVYTAMCYPTGGMLDDGTVFRLGRDQFRWIGGEEYGGEWLREQAEKLGLQVMIRSSTEQMHNVAVQGPNSREILSRIIWTPLHETPVPDLPWFRFTVGRIGGEEGIPVVVSRTGYTGELGYEVFCNVKDGPAVWDAIWENGQDLGLKPMGLEALDMVRIEAGLIFAGYDFCDQTDPFEAGIGFTVPLKSKEADFIGREALVRRKETPARKFVGLDVDANTAIGHGDGIFQGRSQVGEITSAMRSPMLGKNIALARVDPTVATPGTELQVGKLDGQQMRLPATVVTLSHYDPKKTRPQS